MKVTAIEVGYIWIYVSDFCTCLFYANSSSWGRNLPPKCLYSAFWGRKLPHYSAYGSLLSRVSLKRTNLLLQVIIFVKSVQRCSALAQLLVEQNFPAISIHRGMEQEERLGHVMVSSVPLPSNGYLNINILFTVTTTLHQTDIRKS